MRAKFLWIEDNAATDLKPMLGPIFSDGRFEPVIALSVADGLLRLWQSEYVAVVLDTRLPPGNDPRWAELYNSFGQNKSAARLGWELLKSLLYEQDSQIKDLGNRPAWLKQDKVKPGIFGVLTVESDPELKDYLNKRSIIYEQKTVRTPARTLLQMVERIAKPTK